MKDTITRDKLRSYRYERHGQWVDDEHVRGFAVRLYPNSDRAAFYCKGKLHKADGTKANKYLALPFDVPAKPAERRKADLDAARATCREWLEALTQGLDPRTQRAVEQPAQGYTLRSMYELRLQMPSQKTDGKLRAKTTQQMQSAIDTYSPDWWDVPLAAITRALVAERAVLIDNGTYKSPTGQHIGTRRTLRAWLAYCSSVWSMTEDVHGIELDPFAKVRTRYPAPKSTDRKKKQTTRGGKYEARPTDTQVHDIMTARLKANDATWLRCVQFQLLTGTRAIEATHLQWHNVRKDGLLLEGEQTKTGEPHFIPMTAQLRELLDAQRAHDADCVSAYVFPSAGTGKPVHNTGYPAKRIATLLGHVTQKPNASQPGKMREAVVWSSHDLRRAWARYAKALGVDRDVRVAALNHADADVQARYEDGELNTLKAKALELVGAHLATL